eukprot:m.192685 g.192685  ORF g.192685 m.192685 type:complete len:409 (+) comp10058_c0_seq2:86-1312(+)
MGNTQAGTSQRPAATMAAHVPAGGAHQPQGAAACDHGAPLTLKFPKIEKGSTPCKVNAAPGPLAHEPVSRAKLKPVKVEATSHRDVHFVQDRHRNAFVGAIIQAFNNHYPIEFSAGDFWLLILQGLARHVNANAEQLRHKFVNFEGKELIKIRADDFVRGSPDNDWARLVGDLVSQIDEKTKPGVVPAMEATFSTTTIEERVAGRITIMDACKTYASYMFMTMCGFPSITLHGAREDWEQLHARIDGVLGLCEKKFAKSWGAALKSVTSKFVEAFDGVTDFVFWQSMAKLGGTDDSGGCKYYSGWINVFFPYLADTRNSPNRYCVPFSPKADYAKELANPGLETNPTYAFPPAIASAPCVWDYLGTTIPLKFQAGFFGYTQDPDTLAIRPQISWAIVEDAKDDDEDLP